MRKYIISYIWEEFTELKDKKGFVLVSNFPIIKHGHFEITTNSSREAYKAFRDHCKAVHPNVHCCFSFFKSLPVTP